MPRGGPDFGAFQGLLTNTQVDLSELIGAILGVSYIDNIGRSFYVDNFSRGIGGWKSAITGAGTTPYIKNVTMTPSELFYPPPFAAVLNPGVVANDTSVIFKSFLLGVQERIGLEVGLYMENVTPTYVLALDYYQEDYGAKLAAMSIDPSSGDVKVYTPTGYVTVHNYGTIPGGNPFVMPVKFVADFTTQKYKRVLVGEKGVDVRTQSLGASGNTIPGYCIFTIRALSRGAGTIAGMINYVRLTKDEP